MMKKLLKPASKFSHKGTFGHVLIMVAATEKLGLQF
jgi:NAD(P)H-hydrate repair Nnr-like enzyme with NAD(P)H-hydrate dehydratase domain